MASDQVAFLNKEPKHFQIGEPGAPCGGCSTCADCSASMIIFHETGRVVSAADIRRVANPAKTTRGLSGSEVERALRHFGVRGYQAQYGVTAEDAIRATDSGVVLVAVGYNGFPTPPECEVGGKTDINFTGPHAITLWGRRNWTRPPGGAPVPGFKPGWRVWTRDPDHHFGDKKPPYDRMRSTYLVRAMKALIGNEGWGTTMIIARNRSTWRVRLDGPQVEMVAADLSTTVSEEPEFGSGQQGGVL